MKIYYAHSVHLYNTEQEKRDVELLTSLGFEVYNPNEKVLQSVIDEYKKTNENVMPFFDSILDGCDGLAFRSHVDGKIPSGVGYEVKYVKEQGKPIFELPSLPSNRYLTYEDTKIYLQLNGNR